MSADETYTFSFLTPLHICLGTVIYIFNKHSKWFWYSWSISAPLIWSDPFGLSPLALFCWGPFIAQLSWYCHLLRSVVLGGSSDGFNWPSPPVLSWFLFLLLFSVADEVHCISFSWGVTIGTVLQHQIDWGIDSLILDTAGFFCFLFFINLD